MTEKDEGRKYRVNIPVWDDFFSGRRRALIIGYIIHSGVIFVGVERRSRGREGRRKRRRSKVMDTKGKDNVETWEKGGPGWRSKGLRKGNVNKNGRIV